MSDPEITEMAVQTVQGDEKQTDDIPAPFREDFIEIVQTGEKEWGWVCWGKNGRPLAMNAQVYSRRVDAVNGIENARNTLRIDGLKILQAR